MRTIVSTVSELKNIILEILFSKTDKLSKVSDTSVLNSVAYANAKIGQKALKDIAIVESQLFPEYATGEDLDLVAQRYGIFSRLGQSSSSAYIYLFATEGTVYSKAISKFTSSDGISFELEADTAVPSCQYIYAKATSVEKGKSTNVEPLSIVTCTNPPPGHIFCTNTFGATGGRNVESDEELLYRIQNIHNILSTKTLEYLVQISLKGGYNVLKFVHLGSLNGKVRLGVVTQNAVALTDLELTGLLTYLQPYFSISDISDETFSKVIIENVLYSPIDLDLKIEYSSNLYSITDIYSKIQRKLVDYVDFRYWDLDKDVQWDELFNVVRNTEGILSVPYSDFKINGGKNNIVVKNNIFPKFRSFLLYDKEGTLLINSGTTNTVIYPSPYNSNFSLIL